MFIILPSSNECKAYLTLAPFTERIYLVNKSFCYVIGFDIIQAYHPRLYTVRSA
jgi:hypothetical protein